MSQINKFIGQRIRCHRKARNLTLQQLAELIHKSRASVSKYENGEITLDIETLYDISTALDVPLHQLTDYRPPRPQSIPAPVSHIGRSPFFQAERLYFYFYDGRYNRLKDGVINIRRTADSSGNYEASLSISAVTESGRSSEILYSGKVVYSDMLIRFSFVNQYNTLEEDLLYIFNPLDLRDFSEGLLCGISSADLMPCAFKCLVTLTPQEPTEELKQHLLITPKELRRWKKLNMLIVDNRT
ncbi:MAG: helix-turn-helix transcriptional regulator [Oscillospiraceae bacterium]|nr:helix-turn-helix transcriptional regulator [Oscillospiraceae bacterium]